MLGGGVYVTQNKVLPGSYVNVVSTTTTASAVGERGTVAIALPLNKSVGTVIEVTQQDLVRNCEELLGVAYTDDKVAPLREIFCNATKVYVYDLGNDKTATDVIKALDAYEFNILCVYSGEASDITTYAAGVKSWRDDMGKKCQIVVYSTEKPDHEGVISVVSTVSDEGAPAYALVAWVAGAEAGCKINESCTNKLYDGEYTIVTTDKTQKDLENCIKDGQIAFHLVYGEVRMLEDINSLTTTTEDKGEDFKYNQTIRVADQCANDIAKIFNTKYLGKIPNNAAGRVSLWTDIVQHHKSLESLQAIEAFDTNLLSVEQGATKKSVIVYDAITPVNAMGQLYMTIVVQ